MQAVVLAGGLATRLGDDCAATPKYLLEVAGKPFAEWQLSRIAACGFDHVLVCVGHLGQVIEHHLGDGTALGVHLSYAYDGPVLLGTAGALRHAVDQLDDTFLLTYGDSYLPFDYAAPLRDLKRSPEALGTMAVFENRAHQSSAGLHESNTTIEGDWVVRYEKGALGAAHAHVDYGATAYRREAIAALPNGPGDLATLQQQLAAKRRLRAVIAAERFYEIGSPHGRAELDTLLTRGQR